ncbi:MAG: HAMP domain-containing histidine kinase [Aquificae bacterium]|nr:HAMP domain-containing histidine kinase [Aquificota bacterium]
MIKKILPETRYEKEALLKSFFLFFISIEILLGVIAYLFFLNRVSNLKNQIFLEMKNYSYTFEGEKFKVKLIQNKDKKTFYQLYEDEESLYIIVPIPFAKKEALKIEYPKEEFNKQVNNIKKETIILFLTFSFISFLLSLSFSFYSLNPVRRGISLIDEFVKDIIHDLNTPISTILINLKILKLKHKDEEEIERIEKALEQLMMTYENLKFLTKESQKNIKEVKIDKIVEETVNSLKSLYPNIKIELHLEPTAIKTDETAVKRIISNIISNAFKHNTRDGWIKIHLKNNILTIQNSSKPLKNPDKVFERYYKESQRGIGIGLSIVKKLCEEIKCSIQFSYEKDTVTVKLIF